LRASNRPGGNLTGVNIFIASLESKRFGLLHELIPKVDLIAVLFNPNNVTFDDQLKDVQDAARSVGQQIAVVKASSEADIHAAFAELARLQVRALLVVADPFFNGRREQLITLSAHQGIAAIYELRDYVKAGGLMSYGTNIAEAYGQVGI
jgi:putative tryptophan/tyrosine transport system substrate-binding protein